MSVPPKRYPPNAWHKPSFEDDAPPASPPSPAAAPAKWNLDEWLTRESRHSSDCNANEQRVGYNADCICGAWRFVELEESRRTLQGELEEMRALVDDVRRFFDPRRHEAIRDDAAYWRSERESDEISKRIDAKLAALSPKDGDPNE